MSILVLGHKGMLGNAVVRYLGSIPRYKVSTITVRYGDEGFREAVESLEPDYIVNCIGIIPQKRPTADDYRKINIELPRFLETLGRKIIHPSTDCEFSGTLPLPRQYSKTDIRDAEDDYGKSKAIISKEIEETFKNTKIIRTSIIGHETSSNVALLDWFLNAEGQVNGYVNHYWNGITTLQWAKLAEDLIENWDTHPTLSHHASPEVVSKHDLLLLIKEVYGKDVAVSPFEAPVGTNKCLLGDRPLPSLREQLAELKAFYNK